MAYKVKEKYKGQKISYGGNIWYLDTLNQNSIKHLIDAGITEYFEDEKKKVKKDKDIS